MSGSVFVKVKVAGGDIVGATAVPSSDTIVPQYYPNFRELKGQNGITISSDHSYIYVSATRSAFNIIAGPGLLGGVVSSSGQISLPVLVPGGSYTNPVLSVDQFGRITNISNGSATSSGTVTGITAGAGLSGGTITSSGTISLATVGSPGTYTKIAVDQFGRVVTGGQLSSNDITSALGFTPVSNSSPTIQNGTINNTIIGNNIPASGNFSSLNLGGQPVATNTYVQQAIAQQAQRSAPLAITLNWAGGVAVADGSYLFTGSAPYPFSITSLSASVGAGGTFTVTIRNSGIAINSLTGLVVDSANKMNFPALGGDVVVDAGDIVDALITVTGSPTDAFLTLTANKI